jgi:hypothetical protein
MIELKRKEFHSVIVESHSVITLDMVKTTFPEISDDEATEKLEELTELHTADEIAEIFEYQLEWEEISVDWWSDREGCTEMEYEYQE